MKKVDIATSLSKYNDSELVGKAQLITSSLTNNVYFPTPDPSLAAIKAATDDLEVAIVLAKEAPTKANIMDRDSKREILTGLLMQLSLYVKYTAKDDGKILATSGFSLTKAPEPVGVLAKPQNFVVEPSDIGTVKLSVKTIDNARGYQFENRKKGAEKWDVVVDTKSKIIITGLESGVQYEFRVTGISAAPQRTYSNVLTSFIL
ncbi:fibronectin type III domain-containing protein [Pedobacter chitinilyticus]|uniref:Fibronectin type III domain-containing protein n=1 Tax=Pedobacter chitinilyticus TaxID=2233776 RepID=A0A3S3SPA9_9SPHI|nr:fibronectin type III domain-containing protein [Pedobacter chitinilyticus]RWU03946.1 fibronectin type III domain-containing protein [Pedobacter chitinilyticus]